MVSDDKIDSSSRFPERECPYALEMPSAPYFTALFAAGKDLWSYPKWQERTKFIVHPFADDATPAVTGLSQEEINAVKALSDKVHAMSSHADALAALKTAQENQGSEDGEGLRVWNAWLKKNFEKWGIVRDIEEVLMLEDRHPRQLISAHKYVKVPPMDSVGLGESYTIMAERLFGEDGFRDTLSTRPIVKENLNKLISTVLAHIWNKMRKVATGQYERLKAGIELDKIGVGEKVELSDMQQWFKKVDRLKVVATSFSDEDTLNVLEEQIQRMNGVYKALTGDNSPAVTKGLSKNLREALKFMATQEDVVALQEQLAQWLELHRVSEDGPVELDLERQDLVDWTEGVEHLQKKTEEELYKMLGFEDGKIPFLVSEIDEPDIGAGAREDEEKDDVRSCTGPVAKRPFSLKWHQLVGVTKMVECALTSRPIMLMDDVGLGKTLQVLAFFAVMAYYRGFHSKEKRYPGIWGTQKWTSFAGDSATLPECPFLFVVPPTLVEQVASECNRFLEKGSFDVLTYFGGYKTHKAMWSAMDARLHTSMDMRIFVASTTAVQSDSSYIHQKNSGTRPPRLLAGRSEKDTIFGQRYLAVAVDEAHAFRNVNKVYMAVRAVREKTDLFVAMTATPVQTRPSDLWYIGKVIGLPGFNDEKRAAEELNDMKRDLARAKREDKRILKENAIEYRGTLHRVVRGQKDEGTQSSGGERVDHKFLQANAEWMKVVRKKYEGSVIRRTVNSLDYADNPISGLEPYDEHVCMLKLYGHEYDALDILATKALDGVSFARGFSSERFYLSVRKCLLHPVYAFQSDDSPYKDAEEVKKNYEVYRMTPSCKLNSLVEILHHHLAADDVPGIEPSRQMSQEAFFTQDTSASSSEPHSPLLPQQQQQDGGEASGATSAPDKIIVYSYFIMTFELFHTVLNHFNIQHLTIDGKKTQRDRMATLEAFKNSGRDGPRVLLLSNVGSLGLNIAFANILVIVDVLWSVMSDQQLIGRVWRRPQSKTVHVYRLIGGNTPDIFLNNLSSSKGFIQEAFMNIGDSLRKALEHGQDDSALAEPNETEDGEDNEGGQAESSSKSSQKGKVAKQQSEGQRSKAKAPRARPKKGKQTSEGVTSSGKATTTAKAGATDAASESMSKLTLGTTESKQVGPHSQTVAGASSVAPEMDAVGLPPNPKTMKDLPTNLGALEAALPKFNSEGLLVDAVEDDDDEMGALGLSAEPDFLKWITHQMGNIQTHRTSLRSTGHQNTSAWAQLDDRERVLKWYHSHYERLGQEKAKGHDDADVGPELMMDVDPPEVAAPMEETQGGSYQSSPLSTAPSSLPGTRSATPSGSSVSAQSKRSRELISDEEGSGSGASLQKRRVLNPRAGATKAVYEQRTSTGRRAPAQDSQFLTPEANSTRQSSRQRKQSGRHEITGDDSESIRERGEVEHGEDHRAEGKGRGEKSRGQSGKGRKGKGRAL